jgi:hypothetical protein
MKQISFLIPALVAVFASLNLGTSAGATGATDTPHTDVKPLNESPTNVNVKPHLVQKRANDKVQAAYFSNWYVMYRRESTFQSSTN